ncbi:MAG: Grx4 family monothiol glutaredoxin [Oligoflexales bacterium]|nr:Grx4 family monothiol glutaredoxin [Oligoflexales bacterium]
MKPETKQQIEQAIQNNKVMLFLKGSKTEPMCGFSAQVLHILGHYGVDFETMDVLQDWDLREGLKEFSNWPTIPQLYIDGKFIGGCDITTELHKKGELAKLLN